MTSEIFAYSLEEIFALLNSEGNNVANEQLEKIGRTLTKKNFIYILQKIKHIDCKKISAMLMGIKPNVFFEALSDVDENTLRPLKDCLSFEPLLHQLTLFAHGIEKILERIFIHLSELETFINFIDPSDIDPASLHTTYQRVNELHKNTEEAIRGLSNALYLAWISERSELITLLGKLKEAAERCLSQMIGKHRTDTTSPSGIYKKIEDKLISIYDKGLTDTDPAIEALAALSIVYPEDFIDVGLINKDSKDKSSANLLSDVQSKLAIYGLHSVKDVKNNVIFSRDTLKEFIKQASKLLRM